MILWGIRTARNKLIFENKISMVEDIVQIAKAWLGEFLQAQAKPSSVGEVGAVGGSQQVWKPPTEGVIKISVDGAYSMERAGVGVVLRDFEGDVTAFMAFVNWRVLHLLLRLNYWPYGREFIWVKSYIVIIVFGSQIVLLLFKELMKERGIGHLIECIKEVINLPRIFNLIILGGILMCDSFITQMCL